MEQPPRAQKFKQNKSQLLNAIFSAHGHDIVERFHLEMQCEVQMVILSHQGLGKGISSYYFGNIAVNENSHAGKEGFPSMAREMASRCRKHDI